VDCDGVICETGVDDIDWVYSSCRDQSDNEGDLGFSDHGTVKAGPSMHEPVPEKNMLSHDHPNQENCPQKLLDTSDGSLMELVS
jgi:hypothetical protein